MSLGSLYACRSASILSALRTFRIPATALVLAACGGCLFGPPVGWEKFGPQGAPPAVVLTHTNPLMVPVGNRDFAWDQIVDVMDDYFRIEREQRVRLVGDVLTEGRIDTRPVVGATLLEPHLKDSPGLYNRLESTLQTIRRHALVRVIPAADGYLVEVIVQKELEDLARPERTTAGAASFHQNLSSDANADQIEAPFDAAEKGWISQGRDLVLEQEILSKIQARLGAMAQQPLY